MTASMYGGNQLQKFVQRDTNHQEIPPDIVHMNFARALGPRPVQDQKLSIVSSSTSSARYTYGGIAAGAEEATATTATYNPNS